MSASDTPPAPSGAETLRQRLLDSARQFHGADGCEWEPMPPALASSSCAKCGRSSTAHVIDKLLNLLAADALAVAAREPNRWSAVQIRDRAEALENYVEEGEKDRAVQMLRAYADQVDAAQYARNKRQGEPQLGGSPSSTESVMAAREPQTWASMETAPKDGSWYLGWNEDCAMSSRENERATLKARRAQDKEWWKPLAYLPDRIRIHGRRIVKRLLRQPESDETEVRTR